jgi:hypothetical protein
MAPPRVMDDATVAEFVHLRLTDKKNYPLRRLARMAGVSAEAVRQRLAHYAIQQKREEQGPPRPPLTWSCCGRKRGRGIAGSRVIRHRRVCAACVAVLDAPPPPPSEVVLAYRRERERVAARRAEEAAAIMADAKRMYQLALDGRLKTSGKYRRTVAG